MKSHKNRLDKLDEALAPGEEDEVITIVLRWGDEDKLPPITYREGEHLPFTQVVNVLNRGNYAGEEITTVRWPHEELDMEA